MPEREARPATNSNQPKREWPPSAWSQPGYQPTEKVIPPELNERIREEAYVEAMDIFDALGYGFGGPHTTSLPEIKTTPTTIVDENP